MVLGRCIFELVDLASIRIVAKIVLFWLVGRKLLHDNDHYRKYAIFKVVSGIAAAILDKRVKVDFRSEAVL